MSEKTPEIQAAEWLIVGFVKHWYMPMLHAQLGTCGLGHHYEFLPRVPHAWKHAAVRGFVAQEYPKLNAFLLRATPEKQIAAAAQIVKLKCLNDWSDGALTKSERREVMQTRKNYRGAVTSYQESRATAQTHRRSAWKVCK